jgi:DNA-binding MarR family transcriptional regulator
VPTESAEPARASYWYEDDPSVVQILRSVRRFRRADQEMRRRMSAGMDMNETDMQALQLVIETENRGRLLTPRELAAYLGISSASTTKLLDRLTASGHLTRSPHPSDRRSLVLASTAHAHDEIRDRLAQMHARMAEIARSVPADSRTVVVDFLEALIDELNGQGRVQPLTPGPQIHRT